MAKKTTTKPPATKRTANNAKTKKPSATIAVYEEPAAEAAEQAVAAEPVEAAVATESSAETKPARTRQPKPAANAESKRLSAINAAAQLLAETKQPMTAKELIEALAAQGLWSSPGGATPHATLYSAIIREIGAKGSEARFKKADRGKFEFNA